jgi:hypothetical protein
MEMICISTFNTLGKMYGITLDRVYKVKWTYDGDVVIKNDKGVFKSYPSFNFIRYKHIKDLK